MGTTFCIWKVAAERDGIGVKSTLTVFLAQLLSGWVVPSNLRAKRNQRYAVRCNIV